MSTGEANHGLKYGTIKLLCRESGLKPRVLKRVAAGAVMNWTAETEAARVFLMAKGLAPACVQPERRSDRWRD